MVPLVLMITCDDLPGVPILNTREKPGRSAPSSQLPPTKNLREMILEQFFSIHYPCVRNFLMFGLVLISTRCMNHVPYNK